MNENALRVPGSFRDPAGYVFQKNGQLYRRITPAGEKEWRFFLDSGLASNLSGAGKIVPFFSSEEDELTIRLERVPFISYPYEWSFSQLKEAALLTLEIMLESLEYGMILKDGSAFNVAFRRGEAVFMDHTSFAFYRENTPWCAYRQFVMHFLASLLLMQKTDLRLLGLLKNDLNGIALDLASRLLPRRTWLELHTLLHIHLHAYFEKRYSRSPDTGRSPRLSREALIRMLHTMKDHISSMKFPSRSTLWGEYCGECSYAPESLAAKKQLVEHFCRSGKFKVICEPGAGGGEFSAIAAGCCSTLLAADMDPAAVEKLFQMSKKNPVIHNLWVDLNAPTPAAGVLNEERSSFLERFKGDAVLGMALIHHLRISGNWSLEQIVRFFSMTAPHALVEFVPRDDPQTARLLRGREELCPEWELEQVTAAFLKSYSSCRHHLLPGSKRVLLELSR